MDESQLTPAARSHLSEETKSELDVKDYGQFHVYLKAYVDANPSCRILVS